MFRKSDLNAEEPMLAKLRKKLVVTHVASAALALLVLGVAILYVDYHQQEQVVYTALEQTLSMEEQRTENWPDNMQASPADQGFSGGQGAVPQAIPDALRSMAGSADSGESGWADADDAGGVADADDADEADDSNAADSESGTLGTRESPAERNGFMLETWESHRRYEGYVRQSTSDSFVATSVYVVDPNRVATVHMDSLSLDSDVAASALGLVLQEAESVAAGQTVQDRIPSLGLYYSARTGADGNTRVAFASTNFMNQTFYPLLRVILWAGAAALAIFLVLSQLLSRLSLRPVERAWQQQQQFVADASHELKTPLAVILANNSLLMSDPQATVGSQMQWVESTETEAHLMQELVNDMLYLAQSDASKSRAEYGPVDFSDIVQGAALQFESVAFERMVMIDAAVDAGIMVLGEPARLKRLVGTLVDNACKYADQGSTVEVALHAKGQTCRLTVTNAGPVIDAEDLPHLFDRFYRSDKARTRGAGGFGLGLSIAKGVVDDLGGQISATSTAADGTRFTVDLPIS